MSGVIQPAFPITQPFGKNAVDPYIQLPIPVPSKIGIVNGEASFDDGFVPLNMTAPTSGGVPPEGKQFNGILYMITQYCALMQAGQAVVFDAAVATAIGGYAIGAKVVSVSTSGRVWTNLVSGNTNDPDSDDTGWYANTALHVTVAPTAGQHDNYVLPGASDYCLDVDTTAGNIDFSGFVAQRDGQTIYLSNTAANLMQVLASNGGSLAANRVRAATDLGLIQNQTFTIKYFAGLNRWLAI